MSSNRHLAVVGLCDSPSPTTARTASNGNCQSLPACRGKRLKKPHLHALQWYIFSFALLLYGSLSRPARAYTGSNTSPTRTITSSACFRAGIDTKKTSLRLAVEWKARRFVEVVAVRGLRRKALRARVKREARVGGFAQSSTGRASDGGSLGAAVVGAAIPREERKAMRGRAGRRSIRCEAGLSDVQRTRGGRPAHRSRRM